MLTSPCVSGCSRGPATVDRRANYRRLSCPISKEVSIETTKSPDGDPVC
jgi:hypothetical protein